MAVDHADYPLNIRPLATIEEFHEAEEVQRQAWDVHDLRQIVPSHVTVTAQKNGGLVAGAFDSHGRMLGFLFGFLGMSGEGKLKHCSHMMGVLPEARRHNVGYRLKLFQRHYVQKQGLELITWTYDPLESPNATLNIAKLGGIVHKYIHNLYGEMSDRLNKGLPSDRFEVEWWIDSPRVQYFVELGRARPGLSAVQKAGALMLSARFEHYGDEYLPIPPDAAPDLSAETLLVEIPIRFQTIKQLSLELALAWRHRTALIFSQCFAASYRVTDFLIGDEGDYQRAFYVLTQDKQHEQRV